MQYERFFLLQQNCQGLQAALEKETEDHDDLARQYFTALNEMSEVKAEVLRLGEALEESNKEIAELQEYINTNLVRDDASEVPSQASNFE